MSIVMHLPEVGIMSGRKMLKVYGVYNILSSTYVHLLVLIYHINLPVQALIHSV
jgi:hypothetical protein